MLIMFIGGYREDKREAREESRTRKIREIGGDYAQEENREVEEEGEEEQDDQVMILCGDETLKGEDGV